MKTLSKFIAIFMAAICFSTMATAQFEGKLVMKMEAVEVPAEYESMKSMFESTMTIYSKGKKSRLEATNAMTGTTITLNDGDKGESITCIDMMGQKMATKVSYNDSQRTPEEVNFRFKTLEGTKVIAGYNCKHGMYTTEANGQKQEMEVWYTEEIPNTKADMREIPGMTMEMIMTMQGIKLKTHVTEVTKEKVPAKMFEMPEGYRIMTQEEMSKKLMGQ